MENKKIKELMEELVKEIIGEENIEGACRTMFEEALKEECEISIKKDKEGRANTHISGSGLAILITLAGLEKGILEKLGCEDSMYEIVKRAVGTKEAK